MKYHAPHSVTDAFVQYPPHLVVSALGWDARKAEFQDWSGNTRVGKLTAGAASIGGVSGNGAGSGILVPLVGGSITSYINWGDSSVPATFTVCSISRYSGATRKRILTCSDRNWLHGHWGVYGTKYAGATFYDKDMYLQYGISPDTNWVVSGGRNVVVTGRSNTIIYPQFRKWVSAARKCWSQRFEGLSLPVRRRWGCA